MKNSLFGNPTSSPMQLAKKEIMVVCALVAMSSLYLPGFNLNARMKYLKSTVGIVGGTEAVPNSWPFIVSL
jgi:hypothetical protein